MMLRKGMQMNFSLLPEFSWKAPFGWVGALGSLFAAHTSGVCCAAWGDEGEAGLPCERC